jgi:hypothetical protein
MDNMVIGWHRGIQGLLHVQVGTWPILLLQSLAMIFLLVSVVVTDLLGSAR